MHFFPQRFSHYPEVPNVGPHPKVPNVLARLVAGSNLVYSFPAYRPFARYQFAASMRSTVINPIKGKRLIAVHSCEHVPQVGVSKLNLSSQTRTFHKVNLVDFAL